MGKERRGQKARVRRKKCPSRGLNDMQTGLRSGSRTARDNAASVFPLTDGDPAGERDHPFCCRGLGESKAVPYSLRGGSSAWSEGQRGDEGKRPGPLFIVPQLCCSRHASFPWAMLQSLCWVFKEGCKGPGDGPHWQSHTSLVVFAWSNLVPRLRHGCSAYVKDFKGQTGKVSLEKSLGKCDKLPSDDEEGHYWV